MRITYDQKNRILTQVANPELWDSRLNMAWLLSDKRRQRSTPADHNDPPDNSPLQSTRCLQMMSFDLKPWAGMPTYAVVNGVKLALARDLGIEPDLRAFNELDAVQARAHIDSLFRDADEYEYALPAQSWRGEDPKRKLSDFEKQWLDTTEFGGLAVGIPRRFSIEKTDEGFDIATTLDFREWILAHGTVLGYSIPRAQEQHYIDAHPESALRFTENLLGGDTTRDHSGQEWHYRVIAHKPNDARFQDKVRQILRGDLGIEAYDCAIIEVEDATTLVAVRSAILEPLVRACYASHALMNAINNGFPPNYTPAGFIRHALKHDPLLSYVEPVAGVAAPGCWQRPDGTRTFLDAAQERGASEFVSAWLEIEGRKTADRDVQVTPHIT